ncbi:MAG TPA: aldo/keto reductase, partial [Planctomycetaceae bacterium]|nr:aldo/keto reductase [Planctomycetaceae bacterium]
EGKILSVGVSNCSLEQLEEFATVVLPHAYQPHYNMLQREIEESQLPWCIEHDVSVMVYWPLMKGLLAGKLSRDHQFEPRDGRQKYPMFQGAEWHKNHDFLDELRTIADDCGRNIAQVVIRWTIQRKGITAALCGARRPEQIRDNAAAMEWELTSEQLDRIDAAIERRGPIVSRAAV